MTVRKKIAERFFAYLERYEWWDNFLIDVLLWCGRRVYPFVDVFHEGPKIRVVHMAESERYFNISIRTKVEQLDETKDS